MAGHPVQQLDAAAERQLAVDLFNRVWTLMDLPLRTPAQDAEMIHAAHTSRHHWGVIGEPVNWARGEWQVSRVYCVLGRGEPALYHAGRCLELCGEHGIGDFDLAYAHEALARARLTLGDREQSQAHAADALAAAADIADPDDREHLMEDLAGLLPG